MVITDLNYLKPTSETLAGGSSFKYIRIRQSNDNETYQWAIAKSKKGDAYATNYNTTYQLNSVKF
jgi:hypothetical protein